MTSTFDLGDVKVVDADTHIVEAGDLWTSRVSPALRDRVRTHPPRDLRQRRAPLSNVGA